MELPDKLNKPMKKPVDSSVLLWVFFVSKGLKDNIDLMRCHMLCMECNTQGATVQSVMNSIGYKSCTNDIPQAFLTEQYIREIIDFRL